MPDFIVSRMQNRRGLQANLPQPLRVGEFGWCLDTRRLYIGADPAQVLPGVQIFEGFFLSAPVTAATQLLQIVVDSLFDLDLFLVETGFASTRFYYEENSTNLYMYITDAEIPSYASIEANILAASSVVSVTQGISLTLDSAGSAALVTHELANAVAYLLNTEANSAIAITKGNVEILTEQSDSEIFAIYSLPQVGVLTDVFGLAFPLASTTNIVASYSVLATNGSDEFSETGYLTVAANQLAGTAILSTDSVVNSSGFAGSVVFDATISSGQIQIQYLNTLPVTATLKISTKTWLNIE